jgi:hypothetical protein
MSAMPALDWPEDDAASWPPATWAVPAQPGRTRTARHDPPRAQASRDQASRDQTVRDQTVRDQTVRDQTVRDLAAARAQAVRSQAVRSQAPRGDAALAPLRLTRRGRIVIAAVAALLVVLLSLLATGAAAWANSPSAPSRGADRSLAQVVVLPGQSLWSVAENADPNADPRQVMQQIIELNGLAGDVVQVGQRLWVPRG